jgi:Short C-terminal domain
VSGRRLGKISLAGAIVLMIASVAGFIVALILNAFLLDKYNAYGEVSIPGSGSLHLPAGEVTINLHALVIGGADNGMPVPPLGVTIIPPDGVPQPTMVESVGSTTSVNNDVHVQVWVAHIPANATYQITTDGQVNGYIAPRLAFGHKSAYGFVPWLCVGTFVAGLLLAMLSGWWLTRTRRRAATAFVAGTPHVVVPAYEPTYAPAYEPVAVAHEPNDEGVRLERLKTLAALRDSGALTEAEFETEKRRILGGN